MHGLPFVAGFLVAAAVMLPEASAAARANVVVVGLTSEFRGRDLALKGKMMRALGCPLDAVTAMPTVAYIRPGRRVG